METEKWQRGNSFATIKGGEGGGQNCPQGFKAWFPYGHNGRKDWRSFSSVEIQHFRTENTRSDYN